MSIIPRLLPTPPPDASGADEVAAAHEIEKQNQLEDRRQFREDVLLDFAAFESSIVRIQLLLNSNTKERERYAAEKLRIQATAQEVRDNTSELRIQLEESQKTLALRKTYDELTDKITSERLLRPREDQHGHLEKLNAEIADLEKESRDYAQTWAERRSQFGRIIEEGMHLRRLIRDEKEEVERREGMEEREDEQDGETGSQKGRMSGMVTPRHDAGGATPLHHGLDGDSSALGGSNADRLHPHSAKTPLRSSDLTESEDMKAEHSEDVSMAEDGEVSVELEATASPVDGLIAVERADTLQDRSRINTPGNGDQMDTS